MLILNEDRDIIINLSNIIDIEVEEESSGISSINAYFDYDDFVQLGTYKTERAYEILREIFERYSAVKQYEMPKESYND